MAYQKLQPGRAIEVAPNDDVNITNPATGLPTTEACVLYVGTAGDGTVLRVITSGGDDVTFHDLQSGTFLPVQVLRVLTDTSVAKIIALW
jgi:hypothetical protein